MKPLKIQRSYDVTFSPDGKHLATTSRRVSVWDLQARKKIFSAHPLPHPASLAYSPSGKQLAVKSTSGQIVILEGRSGEMLCDFMNKRDGEGSNLLFSPCGEYIIDGSWAGRLSVRRVQTGEIEFTREFSGEMIAAVHASADGQQWFIQHARKAHMPGSGGPSDYFTCWSWPFKTLAVLNLVPPGPIVRLVSSALVPKGDKLAAVFGASPCILGIFGIADGRQLLETGIQHGGTGNAISWSPSGDSLGSVQSGKIIIHSSLSLSAIYELPMDYPSDIAFSPSGDLVAFGSWECGSVRSLSDFW
jgi:WD40 repeat protein